MPKPREHWPRWRREVVQAKRETLSRLSPEDQEQAKVDQQAARTRAAARKEASKALAQKIYGLVFLGATISEIALAVGRSASAVRQTCERWGLPISYAAQTRLIPVSIAISGVEALDRASGDRGSTRTQTIEDAMTFLLADDALLLRRLLHIKRRAV